MSTLQLRAFTGPTDYPLIADLVNANFAASDFPVMEDVSETENQFAHLEHCDPLQDVMFAEDDTGRPIGYARVWWVDDQEGLRRYHLPLSVGLEGERAGATRALVAWGLERVRALMTTNPTERPTVMQTWVVDEQKPPERMAVLRSFGFEPIRYGYLMLRDLTEPIDVPDMPAGLYVRPCTPEDDRAIYLALIEAFRDHWGFAEPPDLDADFQEWSGWPLRRPDLYQVAFARDANGDEQVAGMVLNFIGEKENRVFNLKRGWADPICVRRPWRRRGVAHALIMRSLRLFANMGLTEAALGVDTENTSGALRVYESCGFRPVSRSVTMRKTMALGD